MRTADFSYSLPPELIAQFPAAQRDASRLLVLNRADQTIKHQRFIDLSSFLRAGDLLVMNNSRVIPARLRATKIPTGSAIELLLLEELCTNEWWVMLRPGKRVRAGTRLALPESIQAAVLDKNGEGHYRLRFTGTPNILKAAERFGEIPLPPYIDRGQPPDEQDRERYQTVYAQAKGSIAAPTAGLHFTPEMLVQIEGQGVHLAQVTLHVGLGTFAPVKVESLSDHKMHFETFELPERTAQLIRETKERGGRVIAVGTTSLRVLESAVLESPGGRVAHSTDDAVPDGAFPTLPLNKFRAQPRLSATRGRTNLFVYPPRDFRLADALLTNFHLPQSTLLMLVSAFASPGKTDGREWILRAYEEAIRERYRFFSYGDAMFIY